MKGLFRLVRALSAAERRRLALLVAAITAAALVDTAGIVSIVPFLAAITGAGSPSTAVLLSQLREFFGIANGDGFIVLVGLLSCAVIVLANSFNGWVMWAQVHFVFNVGFNLSRRLLASYLGNDQLSLLNRNSAEMGKNVLSEVDRLVTSALLPALTLFSRIVVAVCIISFLLLIEPVLALVLALVFGGLYLTLYLGIKQRLKRIGHAATESNRARFQAVSEVLATLRELRLYGRVTQFSQRFDVPAQRYANVHASSVGISQLPKFVLEPLAFGSVILIVLYQIQAGGSLGTAMPIVGLFAFAGYRLLPAFQNIFLAFSTLRFYLPALEVLLADLRDVESDSPIATSIYPTAVWDELAFQDVGFSYEGGRKVLHSVNLTIKARTSVGIIGRTGSGKSTLLSLILGLLSPACGSIRIDDVELQGSALIAWQRRIGYVPQDVVLIDDTLAANIALGVPCNEIDREAVQRAARLANIHDFIAGLPAGYDTPAGDRGARLSGGQRQRIGIARALYHDPDVVVFDEATSGLDTETEEVVMAAIDRLTGERTLIIVAHRPRALRRANVVHLLDQGRIVASGTLKDLQPLFDLESTGVA